MSNPDLPDPFYCARQVARDGRTFPIRGDDSIHGASIPWEAIEFHRERAFANYGRTLEQLARGEGLFYREALAIFEEVPFVFTSNRQARLRLRELVNAAMLLPQEVEEAENYVIYDWELQTSGWDIVQVARYKDGVANVTMIRRTHTSELMTYSRGVGGGAERKIMYCSDSLLPPFIKVQEQVT